ncbi:hypothetical protein C8Q75DRAFT_809855 [Abortiporus biennis]|nr:hypothetical protein C8Q75DRAFT_809855 [Abortiporus biennis]
MTETTTLLPGLFIRRIENPSEVELDRLVQIKVACDPDIQPNFIAAATGYGTPLQKDIWTGVLRAACTAGYLFAACFEDPLNIIGQVTFFPPGKSILGDEEQLAMGFTDALGRMPEEKWNKLSHGDLPGYAALVEAVLGPDEKHESWSVNMLAVSAEYRRKGVARALLQAGEQLATKDSKGSVVLEALGLNVETYTRMGYGMIGQKDMYSGDEYFSTLYVFKKDFS